MTYRFKNNDKTYVCVDCGISFIGVQRYNGHRSSHVTRMRQKTSDKAKAAISVAVKLAYRDDPEYRKKISNSRKAYQQNIRLLLDRSNKEEYERLCRFTFGIKSFPDLFDFSLIEKYGWYHPVKNPGGVSRDHRFSVSKAFKMNVDPTIISHPVNCKLMIHADNKKKGTQCSETVEELIKKIEAFNIGNSSNGRTAPSEGENGGSTPSFPTSSQEHIRI